MPAFFILFIFTSSAVDYRLTILISPIATMFLTSFTNTSINVLTRPAARPYCDLEAISTGLLPIDAAMPYRRQRPSHPQGGWHAGASMPHPLEVRMSLRKKTTMTQEKIPTNRANGKRSCGPATPAGRERIRAAHIRHGLYSEGEAAALTCLGEDPAELESLRNDLHDRSQASAPLRKEQADHLVQMVWRWKRAGRGQEGFALRLPKEIFGIGMRLGVCAPSGGGAGFQPVTPKPARCQRYTPRPAGYWRYNARSARRCRSQRRTRQAVPRHHCGRMGSAGASAPAVGKHP